MVEEDAPKGGCGRGNGRLHCARSCGHSVLISNERKGGVMKLLTRRAGIRNS